MREGVREWGEGRGYGKGVRKGGEGRGWGKRERGWREGGVGTTLLLLLFCCVCLFLVSVLTIECVL